MKRTDYSYHLPEHLIAQHPLEKRDHSRLLVMDRNSGALEHRVFSDLEYFLGTDDVLVLNDTKVMPARIFGTKQSGARVEFLLLEEVRPKHWKCLVKPGRRAKPGDCFDFPGMQAVVRELLEDGLRLVELHYEGVLEEILSEIGTMPLPPYIHESLQDGKRYQTIYARYFGSSAAPTAGLHFTEALFERLKQKGVKLAYITLHVGLGTFRPVKADNILEHHMHEEWYELNEENAQIIRQAKRVIAVGTTSVRTLESVFRKWGSLQADTGKTDIFIYPGYDFKVIDGLITNFHLPESTLMMLVSAFSSRIHLLEAYQEAIRNEYRFFSFGDAMLIL